MIPELLKKWATDDVLEHYRPFLIYLELWSLEIDELHKNILAAAERESDRRLDILKDFYRRREAYLKSLPVATPVKKDMR